MKDLSLSPHFRLAEFVKSSTASARGINNTPSLEVVNNLKALCTEVLEPLRQHFNTPITISSGYRSPLLNKAVGGARNSQHLTGEACDLHLPDEQTGKKWFLWMMDNLHFDQLIWEKSSPASSRHWIHVSFRRGYCRQQVISNIWKK